MYQLMYGQLVAYDILNAIEVPVGIKIAIIIVGDEPSSHVCVNNKKAKCEQLGIQCDVYRLDKISTEESIVALIGKLNNDSNITGIIVQLPLPQHVDTYKVINCINPLKDIAGVTSVNYGNLILKNDIDNILICATSLGIYALLDYYDIPTTGKRCVIVVRDVTIETPLSILLSKDIKRGNMIVSLCHSHKDDVKAYTQEADIVISTVCSPKCITSDMIKDGAVVIDVGMSRIEDKSKANGERIVGDVDFEAVKNRCSYITPVPGGVEPMVIVGLILNIIKSCNIQQ
ncbi:MAG: bifunctional 5,10-methylenetetrahydrofolate dehydrogenase/5,10-methenyltetrahydrofolate cyclohydrolase [Cytophagales bacterium]|nr:bifunctional 5,10-methylenetetrahydrofolate dehydrogenase/5,10-methenyltetrahydrofolate cyclohydrolase [Cytophagales bacterium]